MKHTINIKKKSTIDKMPIYAIVCMVLMVIYLALCPVALAMEFNSVNTTATSIANTATRLTSANTTIVKEANVPKTWEDAVEVAKQHLTTSSGDENTQAQNAICRLIIAMDGMEENRQRNFSISVPPVPGDMSNLESVMETIVSMYNHSNMKLCTITYELRYLESGYVVVDMSLSGSRHPVQYVGQMAYVALPGAYYSSSWNGGSGKSAWLSADHPYVNGMVVYVSGVSYLDANGNVVSSVYIEPSLEAPPQFIQIDYDWDQISYHLTGIHIEGMRFKGFVPLGWTGKENAPILIEVANSALEIED